ncbi:cupin [Roseomonas sp. USHLN139]|uniref:cupin n=1 Tax=Roseomonas sp. USHLN139 TaxID=3081298 RepID=UPI003B016E9B
MADTPTPPTMTAPELLRFAAHGWVPNNPALPVLLYRDVLGAAAGDRAADFEALFQRHGWAPQWRDGLYDYHHYHSTAHEALGCARGAAQVLLGGPGGVERRIAAGDVLVLPAGTGHRLLVGSADFLLVGAYPTGQDFDICRAAASPEALARIQALPCPASDPVGGPAGALPRLWAPG